MYKVYDRGADRGEFRFCVIDVADRFRVGDAVTVKYEGRPVTARVTRAGRPYGAARPTQNYYLDLDPAAVGAPDAVTPAVAEYRARRKAQPSPDEIAERKAWSARMVAARRRKREKK